MSFPETLMLVAVVALGLFAGWRNPTAGALFAAYWIVMGAWWGWGITFPSSVSLLFDATVLIVIYCKPPVFDCLPYSSLGNQFCSLWFERSYWDRFVIAAFPAAWFTYFAPIPDAARWWPMWTIAMAQYLAAGGETLHAALSARSAKAGPKEPEGAKPPGVEFAGVGVRGYG